MEEAPLPEDILWRNIDINFVTNYLRTAIGHLLTLSITLAFTFPTAFISGPFVWLWNGWMDGCMHTRQVLVARAFLTHFMSYIHTQPHSPQQRGDAQEVRSDPFFG